MASTRLAILAIFSIMLPSIALATVHQVGDGSGWTTGFDYVAWAKDNTFYVGDTLEFKYTPTKHTVVKVDGAAFKTCTVPPADGNNTLTSGDDVVSLSNPEKMWFVCGISNHCSMGQKLVINVQEGPGPAPGPTGAAHSLLPSSYIYLHGLMAAVVALAVLMV